VDYFQYEFFVIPTLQAQLIEQLSTLPFDSFMEQEASLLAFIPAADLTPTIEVSISLITESEVVRFEKTFIKGQNWNKDWEANFPPILVGEYCAIRAEFHPQFPDAKIQLTISPKMAFGTGHHETTFMMIEMMETVDFKGKSVLDYGCGTGILAMVASKEGAERIDAVDNEYPAYENTIEHGEINKIENIKAYYGTLDDVPQGNYDILLANINKNVILSTLNQLVSKLHYDSVVLFSGFIERDYEDMTKAFREVGFEVEKTKHKGDWLCLRCVYRPIEVHTEHLQGFDRYPDVKKN